YESHRRYKRHASGFSRGLAVGGGGTGFQITQRGQLDFGRLGGGCNAVGKANRPTGGGDHLLPGHARVQRSDHELVGALLRLHGAQVSDDADWTGARQTETLARITALAMADGRNEIEFVDKRTRRLLEDDQHTLGGTSNFRRATGTRQTHFRCVVIADYGGVDVAETVHLRSTEKTNVNAPALQPVAENLAGRDHGVGGFRQLTVTDRQR